MTQNQLQNRANQETERNNRAQESIGKQNAASNATNARSNAKNANSNARNAAVNERNADINSYDAKTKRITGIGKIFTDATGNVVKAFNDPAWYNKDSALVRDVASISYEAPLGAETHVGDVPFSVPGAMRVSFIQSVGISDKEREALRLSASNIYSYVRFNNSGARNYERQDLLQYLLAMDSCIIWHAYLCRLYSVILTYKSHNAYYPRGLMRAIMPKCAQRSGPSREIAVSNFVNSVGLSLAGILPRLRSLINSFAKSMNAFNVLGSLALYARHAWMCGTIFKDFPVKKSQEYVYVPEGLFLYNNVTGTLDYTEISTVLFPYQGTTAYTATQFIDNLDAMTRQVIESIDNIEDVGIMSGDVLKAYGEANMLRFQQIDEDFHIESEWSQEVLTQINAATIAGSPASDAAKVDSHTATNGDVAPVCAIIQDENNIEMVTVAGWADRDITAKGYTPSTTFKSTKTGISTRFFTATDLSGVSLPITSGASDLINSSYEGSYMYHLLNMYKDDVSPDDNMVASRLMTSFALAGLFSNYDGPLAKTAVLSCGSEIVTNCDIIYFTQPTNASGLISRPLAIYPIRPHNVVTTTIVTNPLSTVTISRSGLDFEMISKFDWHPTVRKLQMNYTQADANSTEEYVSSIEYLQGYGDVANYALVETKTIANMHYVALISLWGLPTIGAR